MTEIINFKAYETVAEFATRHITAATVAIEARYVTGEGDWMDLLEQRVVAVDMARGAGVSEEEIEAAIEAGKA